MFKWRDWLALCALCSGLAWAATRLHPEDPQGQWSSCFINQTNLANLLLVYASDHKGNYPEDLQRLVDLGYLKELPTCPAARRFTYANYHTLKQGTGWHMYCGGRNHPQRYHNAAHCGWNRPGYSYEVGLISE